MNMGSPRTALFLFNRMDNTENMSHAYVILLILQTRL